MPFDFIHLRAGELLGRVSARCSLTSGRKAGSELVRRGCQLRRQEAFIQNAPFLGVFLEPLRLQTSPLPQRFVCTLNPLRAHRE